MEAVVLFLAFAIALWVGIGFVRSRFARRELEEYGDVKMPRRQHYAFAHLVLRSLCFERPLDAWAALTSEQAYEFVVRGWVLAGAECDGDDRVPPSGLAVEIVPGDPKVVLVRMPEPRRTTEAFAVAIVRLGDDALAYYTLENGIAGPVLGEWQPDGTHVNYGALDDPSSFVERARSAVRRRAPIEA